MKEGVIIYIYIYNKIHFPMEYVIYLTLLTNHALNELNGPFLSRFQLPRFQLRFNKHKSFSSKLVCPPSFGSLVRPTIYP